MRSFCSSIQLVSFVALVTTGVAYAQESEERRPARAAWELSVVEARVVAIDHDTRELTLRGPSGELATLEAGEQVERLDEIDAGDFVVAEFWTYIMAEFRDPTAAERENPLVILAEGERAIDSAPPGAVFGAVARAVVTIEIINRPDMVVTVLGPGGNYVAVPVEDAELITELRVGEVLVMTYAEALALSLEKAGPESR